MAGGEFMKVTLLNGALKGIHAEFDTKLDRIKTTLTKKTDVVKVETFNLKEMDIKQCVGCFSCWVKTPGKCVIKDDAEKILISTIRSDVVIFASPLVMGMTTGLLKRLNDRFLPLIHPYFSVVNGEIHHRYRYDTYPEIGVLYDPSSEDTHEDIDLCRIIYERLSINFKSRLAFFKSLDEAEGGDLL